VKSVKLLTVQLSESFPFRFFGPNILSLNFSIYIILVREKRWVGLYYALFGCDL